MKRVDVIRAIEAAGAVFVREGHGHTIYLNPRTKRLIAVPRHRELAEGLSRAVIRDARR